MKEKKVYFNRGVVLMMLLITGGCLGLMFYSFDRTIGPARVLNSIGLVLMGAIFLSVLSKFVTNRPALILSSEGLWDGTSLKGVGLIRWDEIEEIRSYIYLGKKIMGIVPKNEQAVLDRLNFLKKATLTLNRRMGYPLVNVAEAALDTSLEEMLKFIEELGVFRGRIVRG